MPPIKKALWWTPLQPEDSITGTLTNFGTDGEQNIYKLQDSSGSTWMLWGSKMLNCQLAYCQIGDKIKIIYKGMAKPHWGGKHPYKYYLCYKLKVIEEWKEVYHQNTKPQLIDEDKSIVTDNHK